MSRMNGGLFRRFIRGCWHIFTTLSIIFHDFSIVRLSTTRSLGGTKMRLKTAPIFLDCWGLLLALLSAILSFLVAAPDSHWPVSYAAVRVFVNGVNHDVESEWGLFCVQTCSDINVPEYIIEENISRFGEFWAYWTDTVCAMSSANHLTREGGCPEQETYWIWREK